MNRKWLSVIVAIVLGTALLLPACAPEEPAEEEPVLKIGAVYVGPVNDAGYNQAMHDSIAKIAEPGAVTEDVEISEVENIPEGSATLPMQVLINAGAELIFVTSYGYYDEAFALAADNPDVVFEWAGGGGDVTANFGTFYGSPPDGWYLMGIAAAMVTDPEDQDPATEFGFVAAYPIGWTLTFVNAFMLGAQSVNPNAGTTVEFTHAWTDLAKQALTTNALCDLGVEVITMHVDSPQTVIGIAENRGVYSIGFQSLEAQQYAPDYWISGTGFTLGDKLTEVAQTVIDGTYVGANKIWSWAEGAMALAPWGPDVTQDVKDAVDAVKADLESATPSFNIFDGPILNQYYTEVVAEGQVLEPWEMGGIDWFVLGVTGNPFDW